MRALILSVVLLLLVPLGWAQTYKPKAGETVMKVEIEGRGNAFIRLYTKEAPKTTTAITTLVKNGFYNGLKFHKVEKSPRPFIVRLGSPASRNGDLSDNEDSASGTTPYEDSGYSNEEGAVGLVRNIQNPNSGGTQFYIMLAPAKFLDGKYTVFGKVVAGMDVVKSVERGDKVISITILNG